MVADTVAKLIPGLPRNAFWGLLGFLVPTAVVFLAWPILARELGPEALGVYLLATSFGGSLAFLDFGFSAATLRFVARDIARGERQNAADVIVASLVFYTVLGVLSAMLLWLLAPWLTDRFGVRAVLHDEAVFAFRLASAQFGVFLLISVFLSLFKALGRFRLSAVGLTSLAFLSWAGALLAVASGNGLRGAMLATFAANLIVLVWALRTARVLCHSELIELRRAHLSFATFRRMFAFSSVMTVNQLSTLGLYQIQRYWIGVTLGPAAVAIWSTANLPLSKVHGAVNAFTEVLFPMASAAPLRVRPVYHRMLFAGAAMALVVFGAIVLLRSSLMSFVLPGGSGAAAVSLIPLLALGWFLLALSPAPFHLLNGIGKPWMNSLFYALNAFLNIVFIAGFAGKGITLMGFAVAFTAANAVTSIAYQSVVELRVWRRRGDRYSEVPASVVPV